METQREVSQALEALHARALRLARLLEDAGDLVLPEALALVDELDTLSALHLRAVMRCHCTIR